MYTLKDNKYITEISGLSVNDIEAQFGQLPLQLRNDADAYEYKLVNGVVERCTSEEINEQVAELLENADYIRGKREIPLKEIDQYQFVLRYNDLTEDQKIELAEYRQAWLDAPELKQIPIKPSWMN